MASHTARLEMGIGATAGAAAAVALPELLVPSLLDGFTDYLIAGGIGGFIGLLGGALVHQLHSKGQ